jgi:hypothetical protein
MSVGRAVAQAVSSRPLTAEALVRAEVSPCWIYGRKSGTSLSLSVSLANIIPPRGHSIFIEYHVDGQRACELPSSTDNPAPSQQ